MSNKKDTSVDPALVGKLFILGVTPSEGFFFPEKHHSRQKLGPICASSLSLMHTHACTHSHKYKDIINVQENQPDP